jgi:membrane-anchored protein YejM (alkaline phosphatase superfamily)
MLLLLQNPLWAAGGQYTKQQPHMQHTCNTKSGIWLLLLTHAQQFEAGRWAPLWSSSSCGRHSLIIFVASPLHLLLLAGFAHKLPALRYSAFALLTQDLLLALLLLPAATCCQLLLLLPLLLAHARQTRSR